VAPGRSEAEFDSGGNSLFLEPLIERSGARTPSNQIEERLRRAADLFTSPGIIENAFPKRRVVKSGRNPERRQFFKNIAFRTPVFDSLKITMESMPDIWVAFKYDRPAAVSGNGQSGRESRRTRTYNLDSRLHCLLRITEMCFQQGAAENPSPCRITHISCAPFLFWMNIDVFP
jgi:hypothetical protein